MKPPMQVLPNEPTPWVRLKALFDETADLTPAERAPLIEAAGLDATAWAELHSLLAHHDQASGRPGFLAASAASVLASEPAARGARAAQVGQRLGPWEIVRAVGEGGMGEVFEARRADGSFEGRAAVKLLKRGMDSAAVLQRFAHERQALARLVHPHIARLLDAGASSEGLPYFVMEFVQGRPIHEAALGQPLELRLRLFLQLADAVSYAHRNLLVHRDLKPSNVLVDGEGQVKLLDFGIAKALDAFEDGAAQTTGEATVGGQRPYTPHYASPEQVRGEPVSTATDIYSLGVLLYLMLTGTRPTGRSAVSAQDAARAVLEEEPTRPSRLGHGEAQDPQWPATRRRLDGDLDHILLMALEKSPQRRYVTVDALAADVRAFLAGRPVSAHAAAPLYVLGKFVRRNRWSVLAGVAGGSGLFMGLAATLLQGQAAAALGVLGLAGGLGLALLQGQRAAAERDRAQTHLAEARAIAGDLMARHADAVHYLPGGAALKADVLQDLLGHLERLAAQAGHDAASSGDLAMACARLAHLLNDRLVLAQGRGAESERHAKRSQPLFEAGEPAHAGNPWYYIWWARAWRARTEAAQQRGDAAEALAQAVSMTAVAERGLRQHADHAELLSELGSSWLVRGQLCAGWAQSNVLRHEEALRAFAQAEAIYRRLGERGQARPEDQHQLGTLAGASMMACFDLGRTDEALALGEAALRQRRANVESHPDHVAYRSGLAAEANNFAHVLNTLGHFERALGCSETAMQQLRLLEEADPTHAPWRETRLRAGLHQARALTGLGRAAEALPLLQPLCDPEAPAAVGGGPWRVAWARLELAHALSALGQRDESAQALGLAWPVLEAAAKARPDDPQLARQHRRAQALQTVLQSPTG